PGRWGGDGVAGHADAFTSGAFPDVVAWERHAGGDFVGFEHAEEAVVDLRLCDLEVTGRDDALLGGGCEGPEGLVDGQGEVARVFALTAAVVPRDECVPVPGSQGAEGVGCWPG